MTRRTRLSFLEDDSRGANRHSASLTGQIF